MKAKHARKATGMPWIPWLLVVIVAAVLIAGLSLYNDAQRVRKAVEESMPILMSTSVEVEQSAVDEAEAEAQREAEAEAAAQEAISYYSYDGPGYYYDSQYDDMTDQEYIAWRESGWNYDARNGRYIGKYQMDESRLDGDWSPEHQEEVAEQYMLDRYGSWEAAREFWDSHGWW